ncbi:MAG: hypothetical protein COB85_07330 [Bacteroidetes bacterium]|nr:MAG: hypothetical protein COB85_07330 [Bacteroidota bacterium]
MSSKTTTQYANALEKCKDIFFKKIQDYGSSWRMLRISSVTDQVFIKAQRIRSIEQKGESKIDEGIQPEFMGILNYSIIALIQLELDEVVLTENEVEGDKLSLEEVTKFYNKHADFAQNLMMSKNHDYDEAWRDMRVSSFTDLILTKLMRIKQIEDNKGETVVSEGIDSNYYDIINYAIFALIQLEEKEES